MKKKKLGAIFVIADAAVTAWNVSANKRNETMSELALTNDNKKHKNMNYKIIIFLLFAVMLSCTSNNSKDKNDVQIISFEKESDKFASELLSLSFLKLETTDSSIVGKIDYIERLGDCYYILDATMSKQIFVFSTSGKYLNNIGRNGVGPGEYILPLSFAIDSVSQKISVLDVGTNKLIDYSLNDYSYISEKQLDYDISNIVYMDNGNIALYDLVGNLGTGSYIAIADDHFDIKHDFIKADIHSGNTVGMTRKIYKNGNTVSFYIPYYSSLYKIQDNNIEKRYDIKFGQYEVAPVQFIKEAISLNSSYLPTLMKSKYIYYYEVFENNNLILIPFYVNQTMYYGFYDKSSHDAYLYTQSKLQDEFNIGMFRSPIGVIDNKFVSTLIVGELMSKKEQGYKFNEQLQLLLDKSTEEDNPILMMYTLKNR